jgi:hypothetical protein
MASPCPGGIVVEAEVARRKGSRWGRSAGLVCLGLLCLLGIRSALISSCPLHTPGVTPMYSLAFSLWVLLIYVALAPNTTGLSGHGKRGSANGSANLFCRVSLADAQLTSTTTAA